MKTEAPLSPPSPSPSRPDFSSRPRRINLDQVVAVPGHGKLKIRPIRLEDEKAMILFHGRLSEESIYMRYFEYLGLDRRTSHERLQRICRNTPDSYAVVVERPGTKLHDPEIVAVGRLTQTDEPEVAAFDTLAVDGRQHDRLAKVLLARLAKLARAFGFQILTGELLIADHDGLNLCRSLGFSLQSAAEGGIVRVTLLL